MQGASQAQEVRNRKASPEGPGERAEAQAEASKNGSEGTGRMEAREGAIRERETRQVEVKRKPSFNDNGDAEAGLRGRFHTGARRKPNAGRSRRKGGFNGTQVPSGSRARWSTGRWELAAARGEGRKAGAICGGTSQRPIAGGLEEGAQALETSTRASRNRRRKQAATKGQRHARGPLQNESAEARAEAPERGRPEGWPEGMAGDEGRESSVESRSRKAAGRLSGCKGRKPAADLDRRAKLAGAVARLD